MLRRGFKTEANKIVAELREELGLSLYDCLDPFVLARELEIEVIGLSDLLAEAPEVDHLLRGEPEVFSAVTVFDGVRRSIVHNDGHAVARQASNVAHELAHAILLHPPTPALDDHGCRDWNQEIEDEANWLAGALLVPEAACMLIVKRRWSLDAAARRFGVSEAMIRYRVNTTGARVRIKRAGGGRAVSGPAL